MRILTMSKAAMDRNIRVYKRMREREAKAARTFISNLKAMSDTRKGAGKPKPKPKPKKGK